MSKSPIAQNHPLGAPQKPASSIYYSNSESSRCKSPNNNNNNNNNTPVVNPFAPVSFSPSSPPPISVLSDHGPHHHHHVGSLDNVVVVGASSSGGQTSASNSPLITNYHRQLPTLQGYLLKHSCLRPNIGGGANSGSSSGLGLVNFRKKRWFVFSPVTGKLYYYRTREDLFPIGEIDIRSASFGIKANPHLSSATASYAQSQLSNTFVFEIVTGTKTITLEASCPTEGFRWVKNLQVFRQYLCDQYLGIETDLANNNDLLLDLNANANANTNSQPQQSTLPKSATLSHLKSLIKLADNSPSPPPQSQSIFYLCDTNSSESSINATSSTSSTNNNNNNVNASNETIEGNTTTTATSGANNSSNSNPRSFIPGRLSINTSKNSNNPDAKESQAGAAMSSTTTTNSPINAQSPSSRPKLFGGLVNRIRSPNSVANDFSSSSNLPSSSLPAASNMSSSCGRCKKLEEQVITLQHDRFAFEDEIKTNREVIKILQEQLRIFNSEKISFDTLLSTDQASDQPSFDRESLTKELLNLKIQTKCLQNDNEKLMNENRKLTDKTVVLQEMLESRDRTLVSLTHEVYDLESKNSRMATRAELEREYLQDEMPRKVQQKLEQLEDTVTAFEQQNEFLNKEIIELNELRHRMEQKEKQSQGKLCEVEAKCSQIQSKLLSLLKELNQCIQEEEKSASEEFHNKDTSDQTQVGRKSSNPFFATNDSVKLLVNRLLEESSLDIPLSWRPGNRPRDWAAPEPVQPDYDELGFYVRSSEFATQTYDLVLEPDKNELAWRTKWDQFISNLPNVEDNFTLRTVGLKQMLRLGVPQDYRCKIWRMLIHQRVREQRARLGEEYYESLLRTNRPTNTSGSPSMLSPSATAATKQVIDPATKQIELDLLRTLPNNKHFENLESDGIGRLRRVLIAYSLHNRAVGYCQGLNRLAAVALLFMPEEDAFWGLVAIVETIMPVDYFGRNLMGAHVDQYVLRDLITEKLPQLSAHMEQHHIEISLFAWFLTVFVDNIPVSVYLHIWDVFLYEGSKVLFRFALAILRMHEHELLALNDSASFNQFLRTLDERHFNLKRLSEIAFRELNPFSSNRVRVKRQHYTALVTEELRKIEAIRTEVQQQRDAAAAAAAAAQHERNRRKTNLDDDEDDGNCTSSNTNNNSANRSNARSSHSGTAAGGGGDDVLISFDDNDSDD